MANFANPTVGSAYTSFPTEIRDAITAALQQLHTGTHSNIPTNAIKWDASDNRWKKYNGSAFVDLTSTYAFNAQISATQLSLDDNQKILLGTSNDFELLHDGLNSVVRETGTGSLFIQSDTQLFFGNVAGNSQYIAANGTNVVLYSGGVEKVKTDGAGLLFPDSSKSRFGAAGDLSIFHSGTNSFIVDSGTGGLYVASNEFTVTNAAVTQDIIKGFENGAVTLSYAGAAKLATSNTGVGITGTLSSTALSTGTIAAGTIGLTGELDFNGAAAKFIDFETITSSNYVEFRHFGGSTYEKFLKTTGNGNVELYFNGVKHFETISGGIYVSGNIYLPYNGNFISGANSDLQIRHDGSNSLFYNGTGALFVRSNTLMFFQNAGGTENFVQMIENSSVILYFDGLEKFRTQTYGSQFIGTLHGLDNTIISLGSGNDLRFYHNGTNSYIDTGLSSGALVFKSNVYSFRNAADTEQIAYFQAGDRAELHFANAIKLKTESGGVRIEGLLYATTHLQLSGELDFLGFGNKYIDFGTVSGASTAAFTIRHTDHASFFETALDAFPNGATRLAFDGTIKLETSSLGAFTHGTMFIGGSTTDEKIILEGTTNPYIRFREGSTNRAYIQFNGTNDNMYFVNEQTGEHFRFAYGLHSFVFHADGVDHNVGKGIVRAGGRFQTTNGTVVSSQTEHVSSITDNGIGDFTFNITAMPDTLYSIVAHMFRAAHVLNHVDQVITQSTTALRFTCSGTPNGGNVAVYNQDPIAGCSVLIFDM